MVILSGILGLIANGLILSFFWLTGLFLLSGGIGFVLGSWGRFRELDKQNSILDKKRQVLEAQVCEYNTLLRQKSSKIEIPLELHTLLKTLEAS